MNFLPLAALAERPGAMTALLPHLLNPFSSLPHFGGCLKMDWTEASLWPLRSRMLGRVGDLGWVDAQCALGRIEKVLIIS